MKELVEHEVVKDIGASHAEGVILNNCIQIIVLYEECPSTVVDGAKAACHP